MGRGVASAPSTVPVQPRAATDGTMARMIFKLLFPPPKELTDEEVGEVIEAFVRGARLAQEAGFDGVQVHCAHGCKFNVLFAWPCPDI